MENILITGATGNIGREILHFFILNPSQKLFIATRQIDSTKENEVFFDFENIDKTIQSIKETQINTIFLLRPPQIADTDKYFKPLIEKLEATSVKHIVFLSVQGAEEISFIPHAKIEKLLKESAEKGKQKS